MGEEVADQHNNAKCEVQVMNNIRMSISDLTQVGKRLESSFWYWATSMVRCSMNGIAALLGHAIQRLEAISLPQGHKYLNH